MITNVLPPFYGSQCVVILAACMCSSCSYPEWDWRWNRLERWRSWTQKRSTAGNVRHCTDTVQSRCVGSTSSHTPVTANAFRDLQTADTVII